MTVLVVSNNIWQSRIFFDFAVVLSVVGGVLAFSILLWCPFIFRITRELSSLTAATEKIATGKFDIALKGNDWDEIGSLSTSVSSMSAKLKTFVTGQKRFLGDIAHELCSPIARLQVVTEMLADSATPSQERYVADIRFEIEEMKALIDELLSFSKAEFTSSDPQLESIKLNSLIESVVNKVSADAEVVTELQSDLIVLGNRKLIERALSNVVSNAVRYAGRDGPIKLKGQRQGEEVSLVCSDCGPGVPADALKMLGEPFYRPEPSRSRSSGGVGLGLAIVKTCIESCDGTVTVRNEQPHGLAVEIRLKRWVLNESEPPKAALREPQIG